MGGGGGYLCLVTALFIDPTVLHGAEELEVNFIFQAFIYQVHVRLKL